VGTCGTVFEQAFEVYLAKTFATQFHYFWFHSNFSLNKNWIGYVITENDINGVVMHKWGLMLTYMRIYDAFFEQFSKI